MQVFYFILLVRRALMRKFSDNSLEIKVTFTGCRRTDRRRPKHEHYVLNTAK